MNTIIRKHYPAAKLPDDLREGIDPAGEVTVTVVAEGMAARPDASKLRQMLEDARRDAPGTSTEEAVARIRALRDEWDD